MGCIIFALAFLAITELGSAGSPNEPAKTMPAKVKQYNIQLRVCQGDPLGSKQGGDVHTLSQPTMLTLEGKHGKAMAGQILPGYDPNSDEMVGVFLHVLPISEEDGTVKLEIGCRIIELVEKQEDRLEMRGFSVRETRTIERGETMKLRVKGTSATNQHWVEATVTEVKLVDAPDSK